jgi:hypothetical protein
MAEPPTSAKVQKVCKGLARAMPLARAPDQVTTIQIFGKPLQETRGSCELYKICMDITIII